jgi:ubiquitin carboxyl-terminal hydrolase L3
LERAKILETTPLFANIHAEEAVSGQSTIPDDLYTELHYTCFVQAPEAGLRARAATVDTQATDAQEGAEDAGVTAGTGTGMRLIELDGSRKAPIDHGECKDLLAVRPRSVVY